MIIFTDTMKDLRVIICNEYNAVHSHAAFIHLVYAIHACAVMSIKQKS